jgi:N-methylhydantoinase B
MSTPLHTGVKGVTMRALLKRFPPHVWQPGDAAITNDPWTGTGHRNDVTIARPIFHRERLIGFALNDSHWQDIGGGGMRVENHDVFEEGLGIPECLVLRQGEPVQEVFDFIRLNTRTPDETLGDLHAQLVASERLAQSTTELCEDAGLTDLSAVSSAIYDRSERAMRESIATLSSGTYRYELDTDGYDKPLHLACSVTIDAERRQVAVDYGGSAPESTLALNAVYNYTFAWTVFALKCILDPETPNNDGCLRPFQVTAPEGSVLNARWGGAVSVRHQTGHYIPTLVIAALSQAAPNRVIAQPGAPPHRSLISGAWPDGRRYTFTINAAGGLGAGARNDGLHATAFPTNTVSISLESLERLFPIVFWKRELIADSGGAGRQRGGCGQRIVFEFTGDLPGRLSPMLERIKNPPQGLGGGQPGALSQMTRNGELLRPKLMVSLERGDQCDLRTAGGGGFGPPPERDATLLELDVQNGIVGTAAAAGVYRL